MFCAAPDVYTMAQEPAPVQIGTQPEADGARYHRPTKSFAQGAAEMRIAYMLTSLGVGGAERQVIGVAERMKARGHAVLLIVLRSRQPQEWSTTLETARLEMRRNPISLLAGLAKARRFLHAFQPDLIHSHTYPANMAARVLHHCGAAPPVISTIHNVYEGPWPRMLAYRLTDSCSSRTTAVCQAAAERFVRLKAVPARKCLVLANGIDVQEFAPSPERRARVRAEWALDGEFLWLAAGRITPAKDYPNLLSAFSRVRAAAPTARLWIAGEGDGAKMAAMQSAAAGLGLENCVRWLGLRRDLPALLDAADGFVLASAWEGMPLAVGEAMAMEKPVVATDAGGVRELVGESGKIVPSKNAEALASAMLAAMRATPEARRSLGRAARQRIRSRFSMDARAGEWEALYQRVLAERK